MVIVITEVIEGRICTENNIIVFNSFRNRHSIYDNVGCKTLPMTSHPPDSGLHGISRNRIALLSSIRPLHEDRITIWNHFVLLSIMNIKSWVIMNSTFSLFQSSITEAFKGGTLQTGPPVVHSSKSFLCFPILRPPLSVKGQHQHILFNIVSEVRTWFKTFPFGMDAKH